MTTKLETLKENIKAKDKKACLETLNTMEGQLADDKELVDQIILPANINELYTMLIEVMGVKKRAIQLKNRIPNKGKRAFMFIQAMKNGLNKLED